VRVLIFHGYLLRGTGSNVYNASLAPALARLGHEVHLLCQDHEIRFGDEVGPGSVTVHNPDIGGLLPVYVVDHYEGFEVKPFPDLTDAELDRYLEANIAAVREVAESVGGVDAALANHEIMGPAILARAGLRFAVKTHGSALEYTIKPNPERFLPYAREGMAAASGVLVGSRHTAESLWTALGDPALPAKTRLGPPGVDTDLFAPLDPAEAAERLRGLAADVRASPPSGAWERDAERAAAAVEWLAAASGPRVVFVGKLIISKGVDLLLAAWPLVHAANAGARLLVVGFGELTEALQRFWASLASGDLDFPRELAARGWALEGGEEAPLRMLASFLDHNHPAAAEAAAGAASYPAVAQAAAGSVSFAGRLEHGEVGRLLPACDALVFPSTFPESFGMVAAEAASAGVLPVSANHSGAAEVSRELAAALPPGAGDLVSFDLDERAVPAIAERLNGWLALDPPTRERARAGLRETVARLWSWDGVARGVIDASAGRLDELPRVPAD
jgi:glycosyltransferase involved in cell wall biosynthesis